MPDHYSQDLNGQSCVVKHNLESTEVVVQVHSGDNGHIKFSSVEILDANRILIEDKILDLELGDWVWGEGLEGYRVVVVA